MKITALLVLKCDPKAPEPVILANVSDLSQFGKFYRSNFEEFIVFLGRTVAKGTTPAQRQSVKQEGSSSSLYLWSFICVLFLILQLTSMCWDIEYHVHAYNRDGLCAVGFMDDHYPIRSAFSVLNQVPEYPTWSRYCLKEYIWFLLTFCFGQVLDEYQKNFGDTWRFANSSQAWPYLKEALEKFQVLDRYSCVCLSLSCVCETCYKL